MGSTEINQLKALFLQKRKDLLDYNLFSVRMLILAMPLFAMALQCCLFLVGRVCSPYPMWISFFSIGLMALCLDWKLSLKYSALVIMGVILTSFTFSYIEPDSEAYHFPMQFLLREGWNPVFDSSIQKFNTIVEPTSLNFNHTLFLPKTTALCGALVAKATGLWLADSFLGYMLFFSLLGVSFDFAQRSWNCGKYSCLLFSLAVTFTTKITTLMTGYVDFLVYASLIIAAFSLCLYAQHQKRHDLIMAIISTVICGTAKTTGLVNCTILWIFFGVYSWRNKEIYIGILCIIILIALIGISPLVTSWIQYGSPLYPSQTFDSKINIIDITNDFTANEDGARMGYIARSVYAWVSPTLAVKACSLYYHKNDFSPVFNVVGGVGGLGTSLNLLMCSCVVLLVLSRKNLISLLCVFLLLTLIVYPLKYLGYARYFPQVWAIIPLGVYQFLYNGPTWSSRFQIFKRVISYGYLLVLTSLTAMSILRTCAFQLRCMIIEGHRQQTLVDFKEKNVCFVIPRNCTWRKFTLSKRLECCSIPYLFGDQDIDFDNIRNDTSFPCFSKYYCELWSLFDEYRACDSPSSLLRFKWLDVFRFFPHPLVYSKRNYLKSKR